MAGVIFLDFWQTLWSPELLFEESNGFTPIPKDKAFCEKLLREQQALGSVLPIKTLSESFKQVSQMAPLLLMNRRLGGYFCLGASTLIEQLFLEVDFFIVSHSPHSHIEEALKAFGLESKIAAIFSTSSLDSIQEINTRFNQGVFPENVASSGNKTSIMKSILSCYKDLPAISIGDSDSDGYAAQSLNMDFIHFQSQKASSFPMLYQSRNMFEITQFILHNYFIHDKN